MARLRGGMLVGLVSLAAAWVVGCGSTDPYVDSFGAITPRACDDAMTKLCSCASTDCTDGSTDLTLAMVKRCKAGTMQYAEEGMVVCIARSETYCAIHDALASGGGEVCVTGCPEGMCDLRDECLAAVADRCSLAPDGGAP